MHKLIALILYPGRLFLIIAVFLILNSGLSAINLDSLSRLLPQKKGVEKAQALYNLAESSLNMDNLQEAIRFYQQSAEVEMMVAGTDSRNYIDRMGDIGYCYLMLNQYEKALNYFEKGRDLAIKTNYTEEAANNYSNIATIYVEWGDYGKAITHFQKAITHPKVSQAVAEKSKKWTAILSASHLPTDPEIQITALEVDDKLRLELNSEFQKVEFKNPSTAGILSGILPGAGQWYVGRHQDAKTAFILNGVFIWGAIEAFNQSNTGVGAMMLLFEAGWYTGNIYSAISGAHKYNRLKKDKFILKNSIDLGVYVIHDDPTLSIATHISF